MIPLEKGKKICTHICPVRDQLSHFLSHRIHVHYVMYFDKQNRLRIDIFVSYLTYIEKKKSFFQSRYAVDGCDFLLQLLFKVNNKSEISMYATY
jgi:hypothetical protein